MKKFLRIAALAVASLAISVACQNGGPSPTEPSFEGAVSPEAVAVKPPKTAKPKPIAIAAPSINWQSAQSIAAESNCNVYALGISGGAAIFVSCDGAPAHQVAQSDICLPYSDGSFMGNCQPSASCTSTGAIGAHGPIYTGSCNVP